MPQLSKKKAKSVDEAESSFKLAPDGTYRARLTKVESKPGAEADVWWWYWVIDEEDGEGEWDGTQIILFTSLSEKAEWKLREPFDAFGVPTSTHTDKLIGKHARLVITEQTAQQGKLKGQKVNNISAVLPEDEDGDGDEDGEGDGTDDEF